MSWFPSRSKTKQPPQTPTRGVSVLERLRSLGTIDRRGKPLKTEAKEVLIHKKGVEKTNSQLRVLKRLKGDVESINRQLKELGKMTDQLARPEATISLRRRYRDALHHILTMTLSNMIQTFRYLLPEGSEDRPLEESLSLEDTAFESKLSQTLFILNSELKKLKALEEKYLQEERASVSSPLGRAAIGARVGAERLTAADEEDRHVTVAAVEGFLDHTDEHLQDVARLIDRQKMDAHAIEDIFRPSSAPVTVEDKGVYTGAMDDDRRSGYGVFKYDAGDQYDGAWLLDKREGFGKYTIRNRGTYQGEFRNDLPTGRGVFFYEDSGKFIGMMTPFVEGELEIKVLDNYRLLRHGDGEMIYPNGDSYVGTWRYDQRHGYGVELLNRRSFYYGMWNRDKRHGYGVTVEADGTYFVGEYLDGRREGQGAMHLPLGDTIEGEWVDDSIVNAKYSRKGLQMAATCSVAMAAKAIARRMKEDQDSFAKRIMLEATNGIDKWGGLLRTAIVTDQKDARGPLSNPEQLRAHLLDEEDVLGCSVQRYADIFNQMYSQCAKNEEMLSCACEDVHSFQEHLRQLVRGVWRGTPAEQHIPKIDPVLDSVIFPKIFATLFDLIKVVYKQRDTALAAVLFMLRPVTFADLGVSAELQIRTAHDESIQEEDTYDDEFGDFSMNGSVLTSEVDGDIVTSADDERILDLPDVLNGDTPDSIELHSPSTRLSSTLPVPAAGGRPVPVPPSTPGPTHPLPPRPRGAGRDHLSVDGEKLSGRSEPAVGSSHASGCSEASGDEADTRLSAAAPPAGAHPDDESGAGVGGLMPPSTPDGIARSYSERHPVRPAGTVPAIERTRSETRKFDSTGDTHSPMAKRVAMKRAQLQLCEHDGSEAASVRCRSCKKVFCANCSFVIHRPLAMRSHKIETILTHRDVAKFEASLNPRLPYYNAIVTLQRLPRLPNPRDALDCLVSVSDGIVKQVNDRHENNSNQVLLGAEDKFPIFLYILIKAAVPNMYSFFVFLREFCATDDDSLEASYRVSELEGALEYISNLDWNVRDNLGVLVPLTALQEHMRNGLYSEYIDAKEDPAALFRRANWIVESLLRISVRTMGEYQDLPLYGSSKFEALEHFYIGTNVLKPLGLKLVVQPMNPIEFGNLDIEKYFMQETPQMRRDVFQNSTARTQPSASNVYVFIVTVLRYPLYTYRTFAIALRQHIDRM